MPESGQGNPATGLNAGPPPHVREMVVVLDAEARVVSWSRAAQERDRWAGSEAPEARLQEIFRLCWATPEEQRAAWAEVLARGAWRGHGTRVLEGKPIDIEAAASCLQDARGETVGTVITIREGGLPAGAQAPPADRNARGRLPSNAGEAEARAISVCAGCKAMRSPEEDWQPAEVYVGQRFGVAFTHSMCPGCIQRFYPDLQQEGSAAP